LHLTALWTSLLLAFSILPQFSTGQPEPIVSIVDIHFVSPNLDMSPAADPTGGETDGTIGFPLMGRIPDQ